MNKERRKALSTIKDKLEGLKDELNVLLEAEQDYFDSMPESFQNGQKGESAENAIGEIENAIQGIDEAQCAIDEATQ